MSDSCLTLSQNFMDCVYVAHISKWTKFCVELENYMGITNDHKSRGTNRMKVWGQGLVGDLTHPNHLLKLHWSRFLCRPQLPCPHHLPKPKISVWPGGSLTLWMPSPRPLLALMCPVFLLSLPTSRLQGVYTMCIPWSSQYPTTQHPPRPCDPEGEESGANE